MNIGESTDVQRLLTYLLDANAMVVCKDAEAATEAARRLADRSHQTLGTGITGPQLPDLDGCDGCPDCVRPTATVPVGEVL